MELKFDNPVGSVRSQVRLLIVLNGIEMKFLQGQRERVYLLIVLNGIEMVSSLSILALRQYF